MLNYIISENGVWAIRDRFKDMECEAPDRRRSPALHP